MSISEEFATCSACNENWSVDSKFSPTYIYVHKSYHKTASTGFSWCFTCNKVEETEYFPSDRKSVERLGRYLKRLESIRHSLSSLILIPKEQRPFSSSMQLSLRDLENAIIDPSIPKEGSIADKIQKVDKLILQTSSAIQFLNIRNSKPRCLSCGSHWFNPIRFMTLSGNSVFREITHPDCGGELKLTTIRMHRILTNNKRYIDIEGLLINRPQLVV